MLKEVADQLYNDIKKNKGKKVFTSSSEFTNIRVKNEKNRRRVDGIHKLVYGIYPKSRNRSTFEIGNLWKFFLKTVILDKYYIQRFN